MTAASVTPGAGRVPIAGADGKIAAGWLPNALAPITTELTASVLTGIDSALVDDVGTLVWDVRGSNLDGRRFTRELRAWHDGTTGADAVNAYVSGRGSPALPSTVTYSVALAGAGTAQTLALQFTASDSDWTITTTRLPPEAP